MATRIRLDAPARSVKTKTEEGDEPEVHPAIGGAKTVFEFVKRIMSVNARWLTAGWTYIVILAGFIVGDWWWDHLFSGMGFMFVVGLTLYGYMMYSDPKKPFRYRLAVICTWITVGMMLFWMFRTPITTFVDNKYKDYKSLGSATTTRAIIRTTSCPNTWEVYTRVAQVLKANLPQEEALQMIDAIHIESAGWRFCDDAGNILRNQDAVGTAQIRESLWLGLAKERGLNIYDFEDNLKMMLIIYKEKGGAKNWQQSIDKLAQNPPKITVIATKVGKENLPGEILVGQNCRTETDKEVVVVDEHEQDVATLLPYPANEPTYTAKTVRYYSKSEPPATVKLICREPAGL